MDWGKEIYAFSATHINGSAFQRKFKNPFVKDVVPLSLLFKTVT
jgi:hypothetical protein